MIVRTSPLLALLLLAGCAGGTENSTLTNNVAASADGSGNAQDAVRNLPEGQRNGVLIRAIRDAGLACQHVQESTLSQTSGALPVYMATCEDGAVYAVAIRDDGTASVQPVMPAEGR